MFVNFVSKIRSCLIFVTPVDDGTGVRDCEAEVCGNILSPQLFHSDAVNRDFKFFHFNPYNTNCNS